MIAPKKSPIQLITTKGIIQREGKILFLKDTSGKWELPGGKIHFGETPKQALSRELQEELGVQDVVVKNIVHVWTFITEREDGELQYIVLVYRCDVVSENFILSTEHQEFAWFTPHEVGSSNVRDGYRQAIAIACASA